jgi:hypothetical protein
VSNTRPINEKHESSYSSFRRFPRTNETYPIRFKAVFPAVDFASVSGLVKGAAVEHKSRNLFTGSDAFRTDFSDANSSMIDGLAPGFTELPEHRILFDRYCLYIGYRDHSYEGSTDPMSFSPHRQRPFSRSFAQEVRLDRHVFDFPSIRGGVAITAKRTD